ncbi:MAG: PIG-L deacetylase family protein [Acetobacteraceae bacterium]
MLSLALGLSTRKPLTLLCLGAHADDIEIGAGGTILALLERYPGSRVHWVVFSANAERTEEARASATAFLGGAGTADVTVHQFQDGCFPAEYLRIKAALEALKPAAPDIVFTHCRADYHQDHRTIAEMTWNTFRDHLILEYEVPKYDPDLGNPNLFVPLQPRHAEAKVAALMTHFASQRQRRWFVPDTFLALMRLRGVQGAAPSGLAEGFYAPKILLLG